MAGNLHGAPAVGAKLRYAHEGQLSFVLPFDPTSLGGYQVECAARVP